MSFNNNSSKHASKLVRVSHCANVWMRHKGKLVVLGLHLFATQPDVRAKIV